MSRFDYVKYDQQAIAEQDVVKQLSEQLETVINNIQDERGLGRSQYLALTKLEECYMWIGKAIRDSQIYRNKDTDLPVYKDTDLPVYKDTDIQEERKDG